MIQPLRAFHRRGFVALAMVLPAILLIGLGARRPSLDATPVAANAPDGGRIVRESSTLWQKHSIQARFYRKPDHPLDTYIVLLPAEELNEPDLLLYWCASAPQQNSLPGDSQLLGAYRSGKAFLLPLNATGGGNLVLFSAAHQAVFDTARVENVP